MSPTALLDALEARGIRLRPDGDRLAYEAPPGVLKEAEREALRAHKAAVLDLLRERRARAAPAGTDWRRVRLADLHHVLEIAVPWTDVPLILAPGCRVARELRARDPKAGRVWCTCEVLDLLLTGVTPEDARKIAEAKLLFNGAVVGARREGR